MTKPTEIACLPVVAVLLLCLSMPHTAQASDPAIGSVVRVQSSATVDGKKAVTGALVYTGTVLDTSDNGRIEVLFNDKTSLVVGGGSTFIIDNFTYATGERSNTEKAAFRLTKGAFRMITSKLVDAFPDNFIIRTPLTSIGIRGTDFWGGYLTPQEFDIVMLEGKGVIVTTMGGVIELETPGEGVTVPDPVLHPEGFAKALTLPTKKKWGPDKLARATATVVFE